MSNPSKAESDDLFERVVAVCDCWPENALRAAPEYAVRAKNHDEACPAVLVIPPGGTS